MAPGNLIIRNASELVTCSGFEARCGSRMSQLDVIPNGGLVIENGVITNLGPSAKIPDTADHSKWQVINAKGKAVLPGFVDSHTHFIFGGYRHQEFNWRLDGLPYMEIMRKGGGIANTVAATRKTDPERLFRLGMARLDAMLAMGVTTVEGKSGYGLDLQTEIKQLEVMARLQRNHPVDVVSTFLGAHAVPSEYKGRADAFIDYLIETVLPVVAGHGLAEFCDIFCEKGIFSVSQSRRLLTSARTMGLRPKLHADEIGALGGAELAAELGAVSADHLLQASDNGIRDMARAGVVATLLPGTAFSLKEPYPRGRFMIDQGCAISLATDFNPGSCFTYSMPLVAALATLQVGLTSEETINAMTINGAAAVARADKVGSLDVGKAGDVVILSYPSYQFIPYHMGINTVEKVIKAGKVVVDRSTGTSPHTNPKGKGQ